MYLEILEYRGRGRSGIANSMASEPFLESFHRIVCGSFIVNLTAKTCPVV